MLVIIIINSLRKEDIEKTELEEIFLKKHLASWLSVCVFKSDCPEIKPHLCHLSNHLLAFFASFLICKWI